jgi:hypothetical protein
MVFAFLGSIERTVSLTRSSYFVKKYAVLDVTAVFSLRSAIIEQVVREKSRRPWRFTGVIGSR